ncbi:unnamed protein product [Lactuca saligna]|uniref:Uncharacterized protein n=1 Tax=Lactuca saligna TaxID=75948 RepID=A0AA36A0B4_LACSI|nr:unnamed protein product [Lactuca saligna]
MFYLVLQLSEWVLCKIYKKQTDNSHGVEEVGSIMNPNEVTEEPNVTPDTLLPKRRRVPDTCDEIKFSNCPEQVDVKQANGHLDTHFQMAAPVEIPQSSNEFKTNRMEFAHTLVNQGVFYNNDSSPYPIPMQPTNTLLTFFLSKYNIHIRMHQSTPHGKGDIHTFYRPRWHDTMKCEHVAHRKLDVAPRRFVTWHFQNQQLHLTLVNAAQSVI